MDWIEDQDTEEWPQRLTWTRLVEILRGETASEERKRVTLYLRRLFEYAFSELQLRIADPISVVTWDSPACEILLHYPWEWHILEGKIDYSDANPLGTRRELVPLTLLTAGTAFLNTGDSVMGIPSMAVHSALDRLPKTQRKKWTADLNYGDWACYGDADESVRVTGIGAYDGFTAALKMMISPRLIDWELQEAYYRVRVSMPWSGPSSPETWSEASMEALWKTVSLFLNQFVD